MVARFRAASCRDKGRAAVQVPTLHIQTCWLFLGAALFSFILGSLSTLIWLLSDLDVHSASIEHPQFEPVDRVAATYFARVTESADTAGSPNF